MGFGERIARKGGTYYRARYKIDGRKFGIVRDENNAVIRYKTRNDAKQAANDAEAALRGGGKPQQQEAPEDDGITFRQWAGRWYGGLDLAESTMYAYRNHLECHLLPAFQEMPLAGITAVDVDAWVKAERATGYSPASIATWRAVLHACLADAVPALIPANPVTRKSGRGRRTGKQQDAAPEKVITDPLGALLIAERAALLAGRDQEFTLVTLGYWAGMRWGEIAGLEREHVTPGLVRVEWQLHELAGKLIRCEPKDGSRRDVHLPPFLGALLAAHLASRPAAPCACHGQAYAFASLTGPHVRRPWFASRVFTPAVSGWYPPGKGKLARPVPVAADPWPGTVLSGPRAQDRADACWAPIAPGMTPHGKRHSHKSLMAELRTPEVLSHERLGHRYGGMAGIYSHVTPAMVAELLAGLTCRWNEALDARLALCPRSPAAVLDGLLQARAAALGSKIITRKSPDSGPRHLRAVRQG